ncbi:hypothetical protein HOG48_00015 [Candidatus Peregrinibacteria bacterium]|nr:hypothetical protein [Candidatus Peregrinibacteria bacterium]
MAADKILTCIGTDPALPAGESGNVTTVERMISFLEERFFNQDDPNKGVLIYVDQDRRESQVKISEVLGDLRDRVMRALQTVIDTYPDIRDRDKDNQLPLMIASIQVWDALITVDSELSRFMIDPTKTDPPRTRILFDLIRSILPPDPEHAPVRTGNVPTVKEPEGPADITGAGRVVSEDVGMLGIHTAEISLTDEVFADDEDERAQLGPDEPFEGGDETRDGDSMFAMDAAFVVGGGDTPDGQELDASASFFAPEGAFDDVPADIEHTSGGQKIEVGDPRVSAHDATLVPEEDLPAGYVEGDRSRVSPIDCEETIDEELPSSDELVGDEVFEDRGDLDHVLSLRTGSVEPLSDMDEGGEELEIPVLTNSAAILQAAKPKKKKPDPLKPKGE